MESTSARRHWLVVALVGAVVAAAACGESPTEPPVASRLEFSAQPSAAVAGDPIRVDVRVLDASGNAFTGPITVTVSLGNANGAVLQGTTSVSASRGVATFTDLRIEKAGTGYVLNAATGSLSASPSNAFDVTHAAPAKLRFVELPAQAVAGKPITPAVTVEITDQYDNRATSATHEVTVSPATSEPGLIVAGVVRVAAVAGLATFSNIALNRTGSYALRASASGLTATTSASITVDLAPLSRYCPTEGSANAPFSSFDDAVKATAHGGTILICDGTHQIQTVLDRALTIMAEHEGMATVTNPSGTSAFRVGSVQQGTVRIAGLNFHVVSPNAIEVAGVYDTVIVEASRFRSVAQGASAITTRPPAGTASAPVVIVRGNTVTGFHQAIMAVGGTVRVLDNRVDGSSFHGILFSGGTKGTIQRNRVTNCGEESCIHVLGGPTGGIEVLDNVIENDIARRTQYGLLITGSVLARGNRIVGIGGAGPQMPINADNFAFRQVGIHITGPGEGGKAVVEGNEVTNALNGISVFETGSFRPSVRNNRIARVAYAFALGGNVVADFERNDVSSFAGMASTPSPVGGSSFRCNWWGRAIGPFRAGPLAITVPISQWQPFSAVPIAGRPDATCDPAAAPPPTRFCPREFEAGTGWVTLQDAVFTTIPGGTVLVCDGGHGTEGAVVDRPLTLTAEHALAATLAPANHTIPTILTIGGPSGTYTIRGLRFAVSGGTAISLGRNIASAAAPGYDQVIVEGNHFTMTGSSGRGLAVGGSGVATAKVVVRGNQFTGGTHGIRTASPASIDVLENTFRDQSGANVDLGGGGPYVVRNNTVAGCGAWCVFVVDAAVDISDNTFSSSAGRSDVGIEVHSGRGAIRRNVIRGERASGDRALGASYSFRSAGIKVTSSLGGSVAIERNSVFSAWRGIWSFNGGSTGSDNVVEHAFYAVDASPAGPHLHRSDFTDYIEAISESFGTGAPSGMLSCNYWGSATGPTAVNPVLRHLTIPFSPVPIANQSGVKCP